jgi:hypothetical protein
VPAPPPAESRRIGRPGAGAGMPDGVRSPFDALTCRAVVDQIVACSPDIAQRRMRRRWIRQCRCAPRRPG